MRTRNSFFGVMALTVSTLLLASCAETQLVSHWAKQVTWPGQAESKGTYKVGNPYKVGSVWYYPQENFKLVETGIASWYGPGFHADHTANGEIFDQNELTAAHRTLQMPSLARITNLENGNSVVVRINDRGPFLHGRITDVSKRAAELLGFAAKGTARVRLEVLEKESRILAEAAKRGEDTSRMTMDDLRNREAQTALVQSMAPIAPASAPVPAAKVPAAEGEEEAMPESLRTPTITVEELASPHAQSGNTPAPPSAYQPSQPTASSYGGMAPGHINRGKFLPDPVVSQEAVRPTGIFIQAGSFTVFENAEKLTKQLSAMGPSTIDPVMVNGRKFWRVKLGPINSVAKADAMLEKVIRMSAGAKVIRN